MGEPTCVLQPFSCTPPEFPNDNHQENEMGESVSFGRFMTEDLSWERWSSFNDNNNRKRYVEEAEKSSRPGSVALKKAYFEAHFKKVAALKAAALLGEVGSGEESVGFDMVDDGNDRNEVHELSLYEKTQVNKIDKERVDEEDGVKDVGFVAYDEEKQQVEVNNVEEVEQVEMNLVSVTDEGSSRMEISPLQEITTKEQGSTPKVKRNPPLSSYMPSMDSIGKAPLFTSSPAKSAAPVYPGKENYATPLKKKSSADDSDKKRTPLHMTINREFNKMLSPVIKKIGSSSQVSENASTVLKTTPSKDFANGVLESSPMNSNSAKRGDESYLDFDEPRLSNLSTEFKSPSRGRNKISSPIIPTSFCWSNKDRAARRKQKLEEKFNATTTENGMPPSKSKEKEEAGFNKFRLISCFKAMSSPDHCNVNETQKSPKHKNKSSLPPRRPTIKPKTNGK